MSPSALNQTTEVIKVVCSMSLEEMPQDVKALEERIIEKVQESGREFYAVRERGRPRGGYSTLSKALLSPKATRLLSPWVEKRALEAATGLNYRPAAAELLRWLRVAGERVVDLEVRAVSWSAPMRATREAVVA
jgi:hypothetical protein